MFTEQNTVETDLTPSPLPNLGRGSKVGGVCSPSRFGEGLGEMS